MVWIKSLLRLGPPILLIEFRKKPMAKLEDIPKDVYALFDPSIDHEVSEENLELFAEEMKSLVRTRLKEYRRPTNPLRFSGLGKPDRQVWMDAHPDPTNEETMIPKTYLKFMYGDVIEQLLLFLIREAGHEVSNTQGTVEVNGVTGHIDAIIDSVVVDVKSASPYGFKKFADNAVTEDDPFGYVAQLAGYADVLTPGEDAAWIAMDKVHGDVCVSPLKKTVIKYNKPEPRIEHLKKVLESEEPPALCHEPVPDGKSGNLKLATGCSYCKHKYRCFPDTRLFLYSSGPRWLTKVVNEPKVPEIER